MTTLIPPTGPLATVLILAHVGVGIVGYGTNALAGWEAAEVRRGRLSERRFLDGKVAPAQLAVLWVPLLGGLLVATVDPEALGQAWFLVATAIWSVSAVVALAVAWPAQRRLGALIGTVPDDDPRLRTLAVRLLRAEQAIVICYVIAFVLMVAKPGHR